MQRNYKSIILTLAFMLFTVVASASVVSIPDNQGNALFYKLDAELKSAILLKPTDGKAYQYVTVAIPEKVSHDGETYTVKEIGRDAFKNSKVLKEVSIPASITRIGGHAFKGCIALSTVNYNANNCRQAYEKRDNKLYSAFEDCASITKINLGGDVTYLPEYLFWGCTGITEITIPENVQQVSGATFLDCSSLSTLYFNAAKCVAMSSVVNGRTLPAFMNAPITVVKFGPLVTNIPAHAFSGFQGLTSIEIPEQITKIGGGAFRGCENLTTVVYNAADCGVSHSAKGETILPPFNNPSITTVTFGDKVEVIPDYLFWGCKGIQNLVLTPNISTIGESAFFDCASITSITIPEGVEVIKGRAFGGCQNLSLVNFNAVNCTNMTSLEKDKLIPAFEKSSITQIVFGENVTNIPDNAFADCISLNTLTIPSTVKNIGYKAFHNCVSLKTVTIPETIEQIGGLAFAGCDKLTSVTFNAAHCQGVTKIEDGKPLSAFQSLPSLKSVSFGPKVTVIPDYIFAGCEMLSKVVIPEKVRAIGGNSFVGCTSLNTVEFNAINCDISFSNNKTRMRSAFSSESITNVKFGNRVKNIPEYAFASCTRLASISFPDSLVSIGQYAFADCASLQKIEIPERVKHIKGGAFEGCINVRDINFNAIACQSASSIIDGKIVPAFASSSAYRITLGSKVESLPDYAFFKCTAATDVKFNKVLKRIGSFAFANASALDYIKIPEQLEYMGGGAFMDCEALSMVVYDAIRCEGSFQQSADSVIYPFDGQNKILDVFIGDDVESVPEGMFYNCKRMITLNIPKKVQQLGALAFGNCTELKTLNFLAENCENVSGMIGDSIKSAFHGCNKIAVVTFSPKMKIMPDYMLQNCNMIKRIVLPEKLTHIGNYAFQNCKLIKKVMLPLSCTSIGKGAFMGSGLTSMSLHDNVSEIGEGAFAQCKTLGNIMVKKKNIDFKMVKGVLYNSDMTRVLVAPVSRVAGKLVLPETVETIDAYAFNNCIRLTEIVLPEALYTIGEGAFFGCNAVKKIWVNAPSMPDTNGPIFTDYIKNAELIVAIGSMGDYMRGDSVWRGFKKTSENYYDKKKFQ